MKICAVGFDVQRRQRRARRVPAQTVRGKSTLTVNWSVVMTPHDAARDQPSQSPQFLERQAHPDQTVLLAGIAVELAGAGFVAGEAAFDAVQIPTVYHSPLEQQHVVFAVEAYGAAQFLLADTVRHVTTSSSPLPATSNSRLSV